VILILPMSPREKAQPFLVSPSNDLQGKFSPDVRWVAYTSDESGAPEVYVRRFPGGDGKWRVSTHGGTQPRWRHDGKEIFYLALDGRLIAAAVTSDSSTFETGAPRRSSTPASRRDFSITTSGRVARWQRILVNVSAEERVPRRSPSSSTGMRS
jgi:Tol biopolymer transport system component